MAGAARQWRVVVPGTLPLSNAINAQGKGAHMARVHRWREETRLLVGRAGVPRLDRALVWFTRWTAYQVEPDDDALPTAFKPVRDGLVDYVRRDRRTNIVVNLPGILADDSRRHLLARYSVGRCRTPDSRVELRIVAVEGDLDAALRVRWAPGGGWVATEKWRIDGHLLVPGGDRESP